jgi:hypothetical protein
MTHTATRYAVSFAILSAVGLLLASPGGATAPWWWADAGTGTDAGNGASSATPVAWGAYDGTLYPYDQDWYAASSTVSGPQCASFAYASDLATDVSFVARSSAGDLSAAVSSSDGGSVRGGFAVATLQGALLGLRSTAAPDWHSPPYGLNPYDFTLARASIPSASAGDLGSGQDAGGDLAHALPAQDTPCLAGHVAPLAFDTADDYALGTLSAGSPVTFTLAATSSSLRLTVLDSAGHMVAQTTGNSLVFEPSSSQPYYLSVTPTALLDDIGYLVGVIVGGPGCTPAC